MTTAEQANTNSDSNTAAQQAAPEAKAPEAKRPFFKKPSKSTMKKVAKWGGVSVAVVGVGAAIFFNRDKIGQALGNVFNKAETPTE